MLETKIIKNYVSALFESAQAEHIEEDIFQQIKNITGIIEASSELYNAIYSPVISKADKFNIIDKLAANLKIDESLKNFLHVLIKNSRENILTYLTGTYEQFLDKSKHIKLVEVKSFKPLKEAEKLEFKKYLETDLIKHLVKIEYSHDRSLIGGILIQYDNKIIDFSLAGALKKIEDVTINTVIE